IFSNIPVGTYTLSFTYPGATPATRTAIITQTQSNDTTDIGTITLIAGDPNGDGQINFIDWLPFFLLWSFIFSHKATKTQRKAQSFIFHSLFFVCSVSLCVYLYKINNI
ncbi:MAG: hypothetical protein V2A53_10960, partial [bacterium]